MNLTTIIVAAGKGKRFGTKKQFSRLAGRPLIYWPLKTFSELSDNLILVLPKNDVKKYRKYFTRFGPKLKIISGGKERTDSVRNALKYIGPKTDLVCIHDGVRPLIDKKTIFECIKYAKRYGAAVTAVTSLDTVKISNKNSFVYKTFDRKKVYLAQTPQIFKKEIIVDAYNRYSNLKVTDDSSLVEKCGYKVKLVQGDRNNIKITSKSDLLIANLFFKKLKAI